MRIYSFRATYPIILGIPFMHILVFALCGFFLQRFFIESYDPAVIILLIIFFGLLVCCDIALFRVQIYHRCFLRFKADNVGILCYGIGVKSWQIAWDEIHTYGITGYDDKNQPYALVFFSQYSREDNSMKQKIRINNQRVVLQVRAETLDILEQHLPHDMKRRIMNAAQNKTDCYYRR